MSNIINDGTGLGVCIDAAKDIRQFLADRNLGLAGLGHDDSGNLVIGVVPVRNPRYGVSTASLRVWTFDE